MLLHEDRDMSTTVDANISMSSTLDNGMSLSGLVSLDEGGVDDSGWSISGDFGKVALVAQPTTASVQQTLV